MKKLPIILMLLLVFIVGCTELKSTIVPEDQQDSGVAPEVDATSKPISPLQVKLSLSDKPLLNKPVKLTSTIKMIGGDIQDVVSKIELPEGFEFVDGDLEWSGDLKRDQEQKIEVVIKSKKIGYHQIKNTASHSQEGYNMGGVDILYVEVAENDAIIGGKPENNWYKAKSIDDVIEILSTPAIPTPENNEQIQSKLIFSVKPELDKEFTVIYKVTPLIDVGNGRIEMGFPPNGFELIDVEYPAGPEWMNHKTPGQLGWQGAINKGQAVEIKATFKVTEEGSGWIFGWLHMMHEGKLIQDVKVAELYANKYASDFKTL